MSSQPTFTTGRTVARDDLFRVASTIDSVDSEGDFADYLVKIPVKNLVINNALPVFSVPEELDDFAGIKKLVGVVKVINISPIVLKFAACDPEEELLEEYPLSVNVKAILEEPFLGAVLPLLSFLNSGGLRGLPPFPAVPALSVPSENTHRARQNEENCQNMKVLFCQNAALYLSFCGQTEDLGGSKAISYVGRKIPEPYSTLIIMQDVNIKIFNQLTFLVNEPVYNVGKPVTGLRLSYFRNPTHTITSSFHVKQCFEKFVLILQAVTGGDEDLYLHLIFQGIMGKLNSPKEDGLLRLEYVVLMREPSQRLAAFSDVLAHPSAVTNSHRQLSRNLTHSLEININDLWERNRRRMDDKRDKRLGALEDGSDVKKPRNED